MTKATSNEKKFKNYFETKFGENILRGKVNYCSNDKSVRVSVDQSVTTEEKRVLIEIDSYNMAKIVVGQYVLLNELAPKDEIDTIFVIIHFYRNYNPKRTTNNLQLINRKLYSGRAIPHCSYSFDGFKEMCSTIQSVEQLVSQLTSACTATDEVHS